MSDCCTTFVYMSAHAHNYKMLAGGRVDREEVETVKTFAAKESKHMSGSE